MSAATPNKMPKDFRILVDKVLAEHREITLHKGSKHPYLKRPDGRKCIIPGSPSCPRAFMNFRSDVRRFAAGLHY